MRRRAETFTGSICKRGHDGLRYVRSHACVECVRLAGVERLKNETPEQRAERLVSVKARSDLYYATHKTKVSEYGKKKYAAEKEKFSARSARRYIRTRDRVLQKSSEYYFSNKPSVSLRIRLRQAKLRGLGEVTRQFVLSLFEEQGGRCAGCFCDLTEYHIDHILAVKNGGTTDESNLQLLCPTCNLRKATRTMPQFLRLLNDAHYQSR